jgi:parallel beta-helix repeat protein
MNNLIRGNHAPDGGGVALHDKVGAKVYWNAITDNSADGNGGGLLADQETALAMVGNLVRANQASNGGGVAWSGCKGLQASRNRILDNRAGFDGGGILHYGCQGVLRDNLLQNNTASNWGGGICIRSGAHPTLINNLITRNTANTGGGFSLYDHSSARALNNTIYHNTSSGIHVDTGTSLVARNTILWANTPAQISGAGVSSVVYSDVEGGWQGKGNLQADPQFRLAGLSSPPFDEDFHLTPSSPCRDSGSGWKAPLLDLEGNPRPQGSGVDMGAYEWMPEAP